jgi:ABC-type bacteriocin/lantibiotic exporter with double-glycine peptidase domain
MILASLGTNLSEEDLLEEVTLELGGLDPEQIAQLLRSHGIHAEERQLDSQALESLVAEHSCPILLFYRDAIDREPLVHAVIPIEITRYFIKVLDPRRGERRITIRKFEKARSAIGNWGIVWSAEKDLTQPAQ